ncbi:MAG: hypothetical protein HC880_00355 [Bacteroidia bacterium]|nr:hypothetical protein [Bacteroidia bacterium]
MKTVTLHISHDHDWQLLQLLIERLNIQVVEENPARDNVEHRENYVLQLIKNPLKMADFTPFNRDEMYE